MKFNRHNLVNVAIAAVAALVFAGFVFQATKGANPSNDELDAIAAATTSTTRRVTTSTSQRPTTTSTIETTTTLDVPTSTTVKVTVTTVRSTTQTTRRTTATTARTTTTAVSSPSGRVTERSDNSAAFSHGQDGGFAATSTEPPGGSDPFKFVIRTAQGSGGLSGDTASVKFTVSLSNNTSKTVAFPGGLKIVVTMRAPNGADLVFNMTASDVGNILAGETITVTQERGVSGYGTFDASASTDVDYG